MISLKNKNILLGVSGGVGAFKACELLRLFAKNDFNVRVVMTSSAREFVTPLSFQSLGADSVSIDMFKEKHDSLEHVNWADWADIMIIAPATANIIGKMANGIADDVLSTQIIAYDGPILIAPAMNVKMWNNHAVQKNIKYLKTVGINFIGPETGQLASLITAAGRMVEPEVIFSCARQLLINRDNLKGKKVIVTAGPTIEAIDPVRYISNHSSGKMGYAVADAAAGFGANVTLISGPTSLTVPPNVNLIEVDNADSMLQALKKNCPRSEYLYMVAAVSDYKPASYHKQKIKRSNKAMKLDLKPNPDLLKSLGNSRPKYVVGFALETENLEARAIEKLRNKKIDMIVANNPTQDGVEFGSDFNKITVFIKGGKRLEFEKASKFNLALNIIEASLQLRKSSGQKRKK